MNNISNPPVEQHDVYTDCPACQGEGEILPYGDPMAYETRCPECNGEGKLNAAYAQVLLDGEKHYEPVERNAFLEWIDAL